MGYSLIKAWTCVSCIGRKIHYHQDTRETPIYLFFKIFILFIWLCGVLVVALKLLVRFAGSLYSSLIRDRTGTPVSGVRTTREAPGSVFKGNKEAEISHHLGTFLWHFLIIFLGATMSLVYHSLVRWFMSRGLFILPWRNNLSLYINDISNSNFGTSITLSTTAILVIWLRLIRAQVAKCWLQN